MPKLPLQPLSKRARVLLAAHIHQAIDRAAVAPSLEGAPIGDASAYVLGWIGALAGVDAIALLAERRHALLHDRAAAILPSDLRTADLARGFELDVTPCDVKGCTRMAQQLRASTSSPKAWRTALCCEHGGVEDAIDDRQAELFR